MTRSLRSLCRAVASVTASIVIPIAGSAAQAQHDPPQVTVSPPLVQSLVEWQEYTGQFVAVDYVEVRARVSGYLDSFHFEDGQLVEEGDRLFVIDPRPFEAAHAAAAAQVTQAEARLDLAESQLARAQSLLANDNISEAVFDERRSELRAAAAALDQAQADLRQRQLDLEFTQIRAPVAGRIGQRQLDVGNIVVPGTSGPTDPLATIVSLDPIYFEFDMSETYFLRYQRAAVAGVLEAHRDGGVRVFARLFDEDDWPLEGRIDFVDNQMDRTSGTIRLRAVFPNRDLFITPGQFGVLRLPGSPLYDAILLPDEAILSDQDQRIVLTVNEENTVVPRVVRPGPRELGLRIIRAGLEPTDRVIINGMIRARPGAQVSPVEGEITLPELP